MRPRRRAVSWCRVSVFGLAAVLCASAPVGAQTCFQRVGGVPGAYGQPPDWWSVGATPLGSMTGRFVDDPRWQGATSVSHISDTGRFRALVETTSGGQRAFVLSFRVKADPAGAADRLYVGFWDESSNQGNVFRLEKLIATATAVGGGTYAGGAFNGRFFHRTDPANNTWLLNNAGGLVVPPLPTWLKNDTRIDVFCPSGPCDEWAVRMRIPIDAAAVVNSDDPTGVKITTGGVFRFWYQIQEQSGVGTAVLYGWPEGIAPAQEGNPPCASIPPYCLPDPLSATAAWNRVQDGGTCTGDISLVASQVYANTPGSITVNLTSPNNFFARPLNNMTTLQPGNAIKATFRLANWGSAIFMSPEWTPICSDVAGAAGSVGPGTQFQVVCNWSVPDPCPYRPAGDPCGPTAGTKHVDQCILVDLASAGGGGPYHFAPQSTWRNMLFNGASTVTKRAVLDARGLPPLPSPAPNRDLYVYIQTRNMPAQRAPDAPPVDFDKLPPAVRERLAKLKIELPRAGGVGKATADAVAQAMGAGQLSSDEVEALMPTYAAYVWYDTGRTMTNEGGAVVKLLAPQPAFGLHLWHDGALHGWRKSFAGSTITELSPNYYRVSVPTNGVSAVIASIVACEAADCPEASPGADHKGPLWWVIVTLLVVAVVALIKKLSQRNNPTPPPAGP